MWIECHCLGFSEVNHGLRRSTVHHVAMSTYTTTTRVVLREWSDARDDTGGGPLGTPTFSDANDGLEDNDGGG